MDEKNEAVTHTPYRAVVLGESTQLRRLKPFMGVIEENLQRILLLHIHNMTAAEMVQAGSRVESRFHFWKGVWWYEVKSLFYYPVLPMTRIVPYEATPKPWLALGGYYHMVPEGAPSNGSIVVNEISDPAAYSLDTLKRKRNQVLRALSYFHIRRVSALDDLLGDGFRIYLDWEKRTKGVRVKRSDPRVFGRWITRVHSHPYNLILGAYCDRRLVAYLIAHAVDGVANITKIFSDSVFNSLTPSSALIYAYVKICSQTPVITKVCHGFRSLNPSLERFKAVLGFYHVSYPAFICLRAPIRPLVRWWMPTEYRRLMGQYSD